MSVFRWRCLRKQLIISLETHEKGILARVASVQDSSFCFTSSALACLLPGRTVLPGGLGSLFKAADEARRARRCDGRWNYTTEGCPAASCTCARSDMRNQQRLVGLVLGAYSTASAQYRRDYPQSKISAPKLGNMIKGMKEDQD